MKQFFVCALLLATACGNNNNMASAPQAGTATSETKAEPTNDAAQNGGLVGEWQLVGSVADVNDNAKVDDAERKDLKAAGYEDYMKLNSDGSGVFTTAKLEGRYEATAKNNDDKKLLTWYDKENGKHRIGTIVSVSKDELHIKEPGGNGLFIWKRL